MIDEKLIHAKVDDVLYVHESFSSLFHGMLNWFSTIFEPRFAYKVISTYDKAVQFFRSKQTARDGTIQTNILPSITLDPNLDFSNEERSGKFFWMYKTLNKMGNRPFAYKVNLKDQGVTISVNHTRYSGTCDVTFWLSSIYELFDFRSKIIQFCGGTGRWIRPEFFWSHIILPEEIVKFGRPDDGKPLDWSATPLEIIQLSTTNTKEYALPYPLNAIWRLDSLSDGSTKYGADQLTEWRFTATFTWEANIPTFLRLDNYSYHNMKPTSHIHITPAYSSQPLIDRIELVDSVQRDDILKDIISTNKIFYLDKRPKECENCTCEWKESKEPAIPFVKFDEEQCDHYPETYTSWDHIVSGRIYDEEYLSKHYNEVKNEDYILLIDTYKPNLHNDYLRKAKGCLCRFDDENADFFDMISSIRLPTLCNFSKNLYTALKNRINDCITMDSISKTLYEGLYPSKILCFDDIIDKDCNDVCNNLLDLFEKYNKNQFSSDPKYRQLNFGINDIYQCDEIEDLGTKQLDENRTVELSRLVTSEMAKNLRVYVNNVCLPKDNYEILGKTLTFTDKAEVPQIAHIKIEFKGITKLLELELFSNYIMTKTDERNYMIDGKKIEIDIPEEFDTRYIRCCSYNGILEEHRDFEVNGHTIVFKLEPMREKIIQVFASRK